MRRSPEHSEECGCRSCDPDHYIDPAERTSASDADLRRRMAILQAKRLAEPTLVVVPGPNTDGKKGPKCKHCKGTARWRGPRGGSGPCFRCNSTGVEPQAEGARS